MKIKEIPTPIKKHYEITCIHCGCVFEITDDDLEIPYGVHDEESIVRCPVCSKRIHTANNLKNQACYRCIRNNKGINGLPCFACINYPREKQKKENSMITMPLELFIIMGVLAFVGLFAIIHKINKALDNDKGDRL